MHCRAPVHHHSIPSVPYQAQYNMASNYICKLGVVEVRDVLLPCLFCYNIHFSVHQYQFVPICLSVSDCCLYSSVTVSGCNKPSNLIAMRGLRDKRRDQKLQSIMNADFSLIPCHSNFQLNSTYHD